MKNYLRVLPVYSLANDKGIESTLYKAPRPSARMLTLSHAPTSRRDIVWAREPLVQQTGAVGLFCVISRRCVSNPAALVSVVAPQRALAE